MYFELKALETPRDGSHGVSTKIQINVGSPFSADSTTESNQEALDAKKVYELLQFVANDLIPRILIKYNQDSFATELADLEAVRGGKGTSWEQFFANATPTQLAQLKAIESQMFPKALQLMSSLDGPEDITQFNYEEVSGTGRLYATTTSKTLGIINTNVPPPPPPPRS